MCYYIAYWVGEVSLIGIIDGYQLFLLMCSVEIYVVSLSCVAVKIPSHVARAWLSELLSVSIVIIIFLLLWYIVVFKGIVTRAHDHILNIVPHYVNKTKNSQRKNSILQLHHIHKLRILSITKWTSFNHTSFIINVSSVSWFIKPKQNTSKKKFWKVV